jgi:dihydroflavonol-4-reductase
MPITSAPVLVTGATGFVGAEITRQLLERGYRVRGTTRDVDKAVRQGHLSLLPGAGERLELVQADLLDPGSYHEAARGCEFVVHVASPYVLNVGDPQRDLIDPAVNGTVSVLEAAAGARSVVRVVLTSSFAAIQGPPGGRVFTEDDWNTEASVDFQSYNYSKVLAERAAWDFVESHSPPFDLVVINPTGVIGPSLIPSINETHNFFVGLTNRTQPVVIELDFPFVDVRDVALAHIRAMERPAASGRYITSAGTTGPQRMVEVAEEMGLGETYAFPRLRLKGPMGARVARLAVPFQPKGTRDFLRSALGKTFVLDTSKAQRDLGIEFRNLDDTIRDTWLDLDRWGHLGGKP